MEKIEGVIDWLREKWPGVTLTPLGILIIALGVWIIRNTTEDFLGGFILIFGGLLLFGFLWLT